MNYKVILKGRLDFGTDRNYKQVVKMYEQRMEHYYRLRVLLKPEEVFNEELKCLTIGKTIFDNANYKSVNNTKALLDFAAQFATSGYIGVWTMTEKGLKDVKHIEPSGERSYIFSYNEGKELYEKGEFALAEEAFSKSIAKSDTYANAFEFRGRVRYALGKTEEAFEDFQKTISIYDGNSKAHFGLASILENKAKYQEAIKHYQSVLNCSIPHEPEYWTARYRKGSSHLKAEQFDTALREFKFFTRKKFDSNNPNSLLTCKAHFKLGVTAKASGMKSEAKAAFKQALALHHDQARITKKKIKEHM